MTTVQRVLGSGHQENKGEITVLTSGDEHDNSRQLDSVGDVASVTCKANTWQLTTVGKCTNNNNTESSLKMETAGTAASVNDVNDLFGQFGKKLL